MVPYKTDPALQRIIKQVFPAAQAAGSVSSLRGLTGLTHQFDDGERRLIARRQPTAERVIPGVDRQREYHILRKLAARGLGPIPLAWQFPWLVLTWTDGISAIELSAMQFEQQLLPLLCRLHRQPPCGFMLNLPAMLWRYWQLCDPQQKSPGWLRRLQQLTHRGMPSLLRLAPLHLDIHRGNVLQTADGLQLIDWEYAVDGDIALELCMLQCGEVITDANWSLWLENYARVMNIHSGVLAQQIARWRPWVTLLMASWYTLRSQQTQDNELESLARHAWQQVEKSNQ